MTTTTSRTLVTALACLVVSIGCNRSGNAGASNAQADADAARADAKAATVEIAKAKADVEAARAGSAKLKDALTKSGQAPTPSPKSEKELPGSKGPAPEKKPDPNVAKPPVKQAPAGPLVLEITTRLGIEKTLRVHEVKPAREAQGQYAANFDPLRRVYYAEPFSLALYLENGFIVLIPWHSVQDVAVAKDLHVVTLTDGTAYSGKPAVKVVDTDKKEYDLGDCTKIKVKSATPWEFKGDRKQNFTIQIDNPKKTFVIVGADFFGPTFSPPTPMLPQGGSQDKNFRDKFLMAVGEKKVPGSLLDFHSFIIQKLKASWQITVKAGDNETSGVLVRPGDPGYVDPDWYLVLRCENGVFVVCNCRKVGDIRIVGKK